MANMKLIFQGTSKSKTENHELQVFHNINNEIYISIELHDNYPSFICFDKATAIKFHRELKKQFSYIREEVYNE